MRAWQTVKPGRPRDALSLNEAADPPQPTPGTVHLEVIAAGIGLPDAFMCRGSYALTPSTLPFTQGQEV
ncbi:MAG: NADPH:quinone oxidoreductase family protein, partial [Myxococcota bacterium]|nr:NADPH:quinone oxidoreductase family protein [Myxococcota bacterium]